jgi:predicted DNA binding CopG/RHH family protein
MSFNILEATKMKLNKEERKILRSVEKGRWHSVRGVKKEIQRYRGYARATVRKDKRVNIRMSEKDLVRFQKEAMEQGLPCQTLISSVLHKYVNGRLVDKAS